MRTIRVNIHDVSSALDELERYIDSLDEKLHTLLERMAQAGIQVASARFGSAAYDGPNDVTVGGPEWLDSNRLAIYATGHAVTFIEFGAGKLNPMHPRAGELGMARGRYGQGQGSKGVWTYHGSAADARAGGREVRRGVIRTHGNGAGMGMYEAGQEMRRDIARLAAEVFGQ